MSAPAPSPIESPAPNGKRRRALLLLFLLFSAVAAGAGSYWFIHGRWHVTTDNAYVGGNVVQITPQVSGTVVSVSADDTDLVTRTRAVFDGIGQTEAEQAYRMAKQLLAQALESKRNVPALQQAVRGQTKP